jgi:hypothetical protein
LSNLALEAEAAITLLPAHQQQHIRYQVAHHLQKLYKQHNDRHAVFDKTTVSENKTIIQIKKKLIEGKAMITKADKGNSIIVLYIDDYNNKIDNFISNNNFTRSTLDTTKKLQRDIRSILNGCQDIIPKEKWRYINLNPTIPTIWGLVKIHKESSPIRPVINWKNGQAYKVTKLLATKLQTYIPLPCTFNVKNTAHLINDLKEIPYD